MSVWVQVHTRHARTARIAPGGLTTDTSKESGASCLKMTMAQTQAMPAVLIPTAHHPAERDGSTGRFLPVRHAENVEGLCRLVPSLDPLRAEGDLGLG
jgi:hypothetical protein